MGALRPGQYYGASRTQFRFPSTIVTELVHRDPKQLPVHTHAQAYFCFLIAGSYREQTATTRFEYRPLTLTYHAPGFEHRDEIGIDGGRFLLMEVNPESLGVPVRSGFDVDAGPGVWRALDVYRDVRLGDVTELSAQAAAIEILTPHDSPERHRPQWLARVIERLREVELTPPPLTELALDAKVHPVHVSRTFRRFVGVSLAEYVRRHRVRRAAAAMTAGQTMLSSIAADAGFADQAHMTRVFRSVVGMTPGEFRRLLTA